MEIEINIAEKEKESLVEKGIGHFNEQGLYQVSTQEIISLGEERLSILPNNELSFLEDSFDASIQQMIEELPANIGYEEKIASIKSSETFKASDLLTNVKVRKVHEEIERIEDKFLKLGFIEERIPFSNIVIKTDKITPQSIQSLNKDETKHLKNELENQNDMFYVSWIDTGKTEKEAKSLIDVSGGKALKIITNKLAKDQVKKPTRLQAKKREKSKDRER